MNDFPQDIYTEPSGYSLDTLACLGPLRRMAGVWTGRVLLSAAKALQHSSFGGHGIVMNSSAPF